MMEVQEAVCWSDEEGAGAKVPALRVCVLTCMQYCCVLYKGTVLSCYVRLTFRQGSILSMMNQ